MAVTYEISEEEFIEAHKLHGKTSTILTLTSLLVLAVITYAALPWDVPALVVVVIGVLGVPFVLYVPPLPLRKIYRQQRSLREPIELDWDSARLSTTQGDSRVYFSWADVVKIKENDKLLLLYASAVAFQIIPKRTLSTHDINDIRAHASSVDA